MENFAENIIRVDCKVDGFTLIKNSQNFMAVRHNNSIGIKKQYAKLF